ncbi:ABC transporter substrate-binding protein [Clostridium perfringens]|nr:ABC transporter substrate-binding protein [Clostridium perfringens]
MKKFLNKKITLIFIIIIILLLSRLHILRKEKALSTSNMNHIVVYGSLREEEGKYLLEKFKSEYDCTYEYIKLPTEEAVQRILDTKDNPQGDVFIGGSCDAYEILKKNYALEEYVSPSSNNIPKKYKDLMGYWTGFQITPLAIGINKSLWEKEFGDSVHYPTKIEDLLNPEFKNKIILPSPQTSGTGYTLMASLYQELGKEQFEDFIKKLNSNVASSTISGFNSIQRVASGEYLLTVNFLSDQLLENKSSNNIISIVPKNAGWNVDSIALIKNSKHEKISKKFIDFVLSDETAKDLSNFSKAISTKNFDTNQFKIYDKYSFYLAAEDRNRIMQILFNNKN